MIKITKDRANEIFRELTLSDIKVLFSLVPYMEESGFVVINSQVRLVLQKELDISRQTLGTSLSKLNRATLLLNIGGATIYNDQFIQI